MIDSVRVNGMCFHIAVSRINEILFGDSMSHPNDKINTLLIIADKTDTLIVPREIITELENNYSTIVLDNYMSEIELKFNAEELFKNSCNNPEKGLIDTNTFEKELEHLLNKYSIDNYCNTPDYILAKYIVNSLEPLKELLKANSERSDDTIMVYQPLTKKNKH